MNVAEDGFDLYDGLSGYFDDVVEFEGKKARMEVSIVDPPPLLQVQLQVSFAVSSLSCVLTLRSREYNSIAKHCNRTSHRRTSSLERPFTWIGS